MFVPTGDVSQERVSVGLFINAGGSENQNKRRTGGLVWLERHSCRTVLAQESIFREVVPLIWHRYKRDILTQYLHDKGKWKRNLKSSDCCFASQTKGIHVAAFLYFMEFDALWPHAPLPFF